MIRPSLGNMVNNHKTPMNLKVHSDVEVVNYEAQFGKWKIQLTMRINFISSKDSEETCTMHTKIDNVEIMIDSETNDIIDELFESRLQRYQEELEKPIWGGELVLNKVDLLHYHIQNISGSYVDSPRWLNNKKATVNPKINDNNCF